MPDSFVFGTIIERGIALAARYSSVPNGEGGTTTTVSWYDLPEELRLNSNAIRIYGDAFGRLFLTDGINSYMVPMNTGDTYYGIGSWRGTVADFIAQPGLIVTPADATELFYAIVLGQHLGLADSNLTVTNFLQRIVYPSGLTINLMEGVLVTGTDAPETLYGFGRNVFGNDLNDTINAGDGDDVVYGMTGNDILNGQGGNDRLFGGQGNDSFDGGTGFDTAVIDFSNSGQPVNLVADTVTPGFQTSIIIGGVAAGTLANIESLELTGGSGADRLGGSFAFNPVASTSSNIDGGSGRDVAVINLGNFVSNISQAGSIGFGNFSSIAPNGFTFSIGTQNIEALDFTGGSGDDLVRGGNDDDILRGGAGIDTLSGGRGNDVIIGDTGNDTLNGEDGNDYLIGGEGNDILAGSIGSNTMQGGTGDDVYILINGGDSIIEFADEGFDRIRTSLTTVIMSDNVEWLSYEGGGIPALLTGSATDNVIDGGTGRDELFGRDGNDVLADVGSADGQGDFMAGGTGNDVYLVSNRGSSTFESVGEGIDEVRTVISIYGLQANIENLTATDNGTHGALVGNILANTITGGTGTDDLFGREGNDRLVGGSGAANSLYGQEGDDVYVVSAAGDSVIEFAGQGSDRVEAATASFTLGANVEDLTFTGAATVRIGVGNDIGNAIRGAAGDDQLNGAGGDDVIIGGSGADILQGGTGADQFRYEGGETDMDRILDFVSGTDRIALSSAAFTPTTTVAFVSAPGATANSANSTFLHDSNTGIIWYDDDGNGAGAAIAIAQLNFGQTVAAGDFIFY